MCKSRLLGGIGSVLALTFLSGVSAGVQPVNKRRLAVSYGRLPLSFAANHGQTDPRVNFLSRGVGYNLFLTSSEAILAVHGNVAQSVSRRTAALLRMRLVGASQSAKVTALEELPAKANYFIGNDPKKWRTNVPTYRKVKYESVYPGIDRPRSEPEAEPLLLNRKSQLEENNSACL